MMDHSGKRVMVTGAAGGAGIGICKAFAKAGAEVVMTDINVDGLDQLHAELSRVEDWPRYSRGISVPAKAVASSPRVAGRSMC